MRKGIGEHKSNKESELQCTITQTQRSGKRNVTNEKSGRRLTSTTKRRAAVASDPRRGCISLNAASESSRKLPELVRTRRSPSRRSGLASGNWASFRDERLRERSTETDLLRVLTVTEWARGRIFSLLSHAPRGVARDLPRVNAHRQGTPARKTCSYKYS